MPKVVRRVSRGFGNPPCGEHFVVPETESTGTAVMAVPVSAYVSGRPTDEYDWSNLVQLDLDTVEEVDDAEQTGV